MIDKEEEEIELKENEKIRNNIWKNLDDALEELNKIPIKNTDEEYEKAARRVEEVLHLQYCFEMTQNRIMLLKKSQKRMRDIVKSSVQTNSFIQKIGVVLIAMGVVMFGLMVLQGIEALEAEPEDKGLPTMMSAIFGITGIADILVIMKFVMNRSQKALADMVQVIVTYLSFKSQKDNLEEWSQKKEMHHNHEEEISLKELIEINKNISIASTQTIKDIQTFVEEKCVKDESLEEKSKD